MIQPVTPIMRNRAKSLRTEQTEPEDLLWQTLRAKRLEGLKFRRQVPMGSYIVDFYCAEHRLIVELDGSQHGEDRAVAYDTRRTYWLEDQGYKVIRFWNDDVLRDLDGVCQSILADCGILQKDAEGRVS